MTGVVATEKKRVSVALHIEEAIDKVVDDHAYDAIIATDRGGKIQRVNTMAVKEFGYGSKEELIDTNLSILMHGVIDHPEFLLDSHGEQRIICITRKDGSEMECIVATRNIKGTPIVASYIRNLNPVKSNVKLPSKER
jgi:PAS domain S-box-containing protein